MGKIKVEKDFEHSNLRCVVIMTPMGHRCGYVGIPKEHPLYGLNYSEKSKYLLLKNIEEQPIGKRGVIPLFCSTTEESGYMSPDCYFDVHGGITYSGSNNYPVESDLWWFGYDCGHWDDAPDLLAIENEPVRAMLQGFPRSGIVRSLEYCADECKSLAEQLSQIKEG